jgi:hypothetical protein
VARSLGPASLKANHVGLDVLVHRSDSNRVSVLSRDPDSLLDSFALALANQAARHNVTLSLWTRDGSERQFFVNADTGKIPVNVHYSQSERGWWGLQPTTIQRLLGEPQSVVVLLRGAYSGYLLTVARLRRLLPTFSRTTKGSYHIAESKVAREPHFSSVEQLWTLLGVQPGAPSETAPPN